MFKISRSLFIFLSLLTAVCILLAGCSKNTETAILTTTATNASNVSSLSVNHPTATSVLSGSTVIVSVSPTITSASTTPSKEFTDQEIAANSISATAKMNSFKFDIDSSMSFTLPTEGTTTTMSMKQTATSAVNISEKQMDIAMNMVMEIPNQGTQNVTAEIYLVDGWMYMKANVPGVGDQWTKMKLTDELWAMQSKFSSMTDFLKSPVGLESTGSEKINGIDCYVLNVVPDIASLTSWMESQIQSGQTGIDLNGLDMSKILQNFTVKEWIAKDSFLVVKQQIGIKLDMSSLDSGNSIGANQMKMEMNVTLTFYDYGKPVIIQLPPEALNAKETTLPQ